MPKMIALTLRNGGSAVMPSPAPGADQLAGGVEDDAAPATSARPGSSRAWWWAGASVFLLVIVVLFDAYLHLSKTYTENSDEANILLMANDMLHGNVYLSGLERLRRAVHHHRAAGDHAAGVDVRAAPEHGPHRGGGHLHRS